MTTLPRGIAALVLFLLALPVSNAWGQEPTYPPARTPREAGEPPPVPSDDIDVQPRGPVHEAFAVPSDMTPRPGPIVSKKPPDPIPEVPPEQKPEGDNVQWIPGYWAWDAERKDYLWVSGLWRVPPAGRKWVPGTWNAVEGGYRWSPGFWVPADQDQTPYLPAPPDSLDNGPSSPPPDDDSFYVPGNWMYQSSQYLWQPGYWQAYRPGMIWTPSYYFWTPAGYLFVPGYWDWPLMNRGLLFAPVAFNRPLWTTPGWFYQPNYFIAYNGLVSALFNGPIGGGFFFGNYYGPTYRRLGFRPWFATTGGVYSPLFAWYRWRNRSNPGWLSGLTALYRGRSNGSLTRPPLTLAQQTTILNNAANVRTGAVSSLQMVQPLSQVSAVRLTRLNAAQVNELRGLSQRFQQFSVQRQGVERLVVRETRRALSLSRLPGAAAAAPAIRGTTGYSSLLSGTVTHVHSAPAVAPRVAEPRIITTHHAAGSASMPRILTPAHPLPSAARIEHGVIAHHNPAPVVHHASPAPVHHAPAASHHAPPAHHFAPPAHHTAPPSHAGGHGGGHGGGHSGGHGGGHHR